MGRGSTKILIKKIIECLTEGPKTISEIVRSTELDRTAVGKYLNLLKESGLLNEEGQKTSKVYSLVKTFKTDTYFGLPLDKETNEKVESIYYFIKQEYEKKIGRKLLKTTAQKIMYKIIKQCNLNIPSGWYIYGGICIKPYDYDFNYNYFGLDENIISCIKTTTEEFSHHNKEYKSKQYQYKEAKKELYILKEEILALLYSKNFSKNSFYIFQKKYLKFIHSIPLSNSSYMHLTMEYQTLLIDIIKYWDDFISEKDDVSFTKFKQILISSFESLWKLIALFNFKKDLLENGYYTQSVLDEYFKLDIKQAKEELIEIGSQINEMIPFEDLDDPNYKKIKDALNEANKPVSEEELKKQKEELNKIKEEKSLSAYNKELFKRVGLD